MMRKLAHVMAWHGLWQQRSPMSRRTPLAYRSRSSAYFGFAPAIEYNWRNNLGMLIDVRVFIGGHNSPTTITPVIALNYVH